MDANTPPPHKHTECKSCKAVDKELFFMPNARDDKDYFCKECKVVETEKRAKE